MSRIGSGTGTKRDGQLVEKLAIVRRLVQIEERLDSGRDLECTLDALDALEGWWPPELGVDEADE